MRILHSSCTVQLFPGLVVHTRDSHDKTPLGNALQSSIVLETTRAVAHGNRPCLLRGHSFWAFVFPGPQHQCYCQASLSANLFP